MTPAARARSLSLRRRRAGATRRRDPRRGVDCARRRARRCGSLQSVPIPLRSTDDFSRSSGIPVSGRPNRGQSDSGARAVPPPSPSRRRSDGTHPGAMPPKEEKPELTEEEKLVMAEAQALKVRGDDVATRGSQRSIAGGPPRLGSRATNASASRTNFSRPPPPPPSSIPSPIPHPPSRPAGGGSAKGEARGAARADAPAHDGRGATSPRQRPPHSHALATDHARRQGQGAARRDRDPQARSILHWSPYDPVRVVNAVS